MLKFKTDYLAIKIWESKILRYVPKDHYVHQRRCNHHHQQRSCQVQQSLEFHFSIWVCCFQFHADKPRFCQSEFQQPGILLRRSLSVLKWWPLEIHGLYQISPMIIASRTWEFHWENQFRCLLLSHNDHSYNKLLILNAPYLNQGFHFFTRVILFLVTAATLKTKLNVSKNRTSLDAKPK